MAAAASSLSPGSAVGDWQRSNAWNSFCRGWPNKEARGAGRGFPEQTVANQKSKLIAKSRHAVAQPRAAWVGWCFPKLYDRGKIDAMGESTPLVRTGGYLRALPTGRDGPHREGPGKDPELARQLVGLNARRDAGVHSLGEIWRRHRLTCGTARTVGWLPAGDHSLGAGRLPPLPRRGGRLPLLPGQPDGPGKTPGRKQRGGTNPTPQVLPVKRRLSAAGVVGSCRLAVGSCVAANR